MASVQGIYLAFFGRPADPAGLSYFNGVTNNGKDLAGISNLAGQKEFTDRFTGMNNTQIINSIYQSLFGRDGEPAGVSFWTEKLTSGALSINKIAIAILDAAQNEDKATINAKLAAADLFTTHLDLPAEQSAYTAATVELVKNYIATINASKPATAAEVDALILQLQSSGGQAPGGDGGNVGGGGGGNGGATPDTTAPVGTVDPQSAGDHTFKADEKITFTVNFNELSFVDGNPQLLLSNGAIATYESGTGTTQFKFGYTVPSGMNVADLEVSSITGGGIKDAAGNTGTITATTSLDIVIDTTSPVGTVDLASSSTGSASAGSTLKFVVNYSEPVAPDGSPTLTLTGGREATLSSSTDTQQTFTYVVKPTDVAQDLEVVGLKGSVVDPAGNKASVSATTTLDIAFGPQAGQVYVIDGQTNAIKAIYSATPGQGVTTSTNPVGDAITGTQSANGDKILIGSGTFTLPSTVTVDKQLTILGSNHGIDPTDATASRQAETVLKGANNVGIAFELVVKSGVHTNNVTIDGLVFDSFKSTVTSNTGVIKLTGSAVNQNLHIENNIFQGSNIPAFNSQSGTKDYVIEHNVFKDFKSTGYGNLSAIEISTSNSGGSSGGTIDGNLFQNIRGVGPGTASADQSHAFILGGGSSGGGMQNQTTIINNTIDGTDAAGMRLQGNMSSVEVHHNTVTNANSLGIDSDAAIRIQLSTATGSVSVHDNNISDSFHAFALTGGSGTIVPSIFGNNISKIDGLSFVTYYNTAANYSTVANTLDGDSVYVVLGSQGSDTISVVPPTGKGLYIIGGTGNDTISGTVNADVYAFGSKDGVDTITNFGTGDKLDLGPQKLSFALLDTNNDDVLNDADDIVSVANQNLTITFSSGNSVTLQGITQLTQADFL